MSDSVIKANKKYYPQTLLEECKYEQGKYEQERIKIENFFMMNLIKVCQMSLIMLLMNNLLKAKNVF